MDNPGNHFPIPRIVFVGESGSGKTALIQKIMHPSLPVERLYEPTIGAELHRGTILSTPFILWDLSGNKQYFRICSVYVQNADACVYVYDTTNNYSFYQLRTWYRYTKKYVYANTPLIVVGTKTDQFVHRSVSREEGEYFAKSINAHYIESSIFDEEPILSKTLGSLCIPKPVPDTSSPAPKKSSCCRCDIL